MSEPRRFYPAVKRIADLIAASVALALLWPVMATIGCVVALRLGRPVLFRQDRPGLNGKVFTLLKFRSMHDVDPMRGLVTDAARLTAFGRLLRASSLDELPSLVNVLRGEMSIVGPRPLLVEYLGRYSFEEARRHDVRPGMTGLAQVSGRNTAPWSTRLELDVHYVDFVSARLDLSIIARTIAVVLSRSGITADGHATSPEFRAAPGGTS